MAKLRCEVSTGLRPAEASVTVTEYDGTPQYFPLDRGLVDTSNGKTTIPVLILQENEDGDLALVTLPVEADSGTQRIWVAFEQLEDVEETVR